MALGVARLVDDHPTKAVEPGRAPWGLGPRLRAGAYAAHRVPVHAHELGDRRHAAVDAQPRDLVIERLREARVGSPRHGLDALAVRGAVHEIRRLLKVAPG